MNHRFILFLALMLLVMTMHQYVMNLLWPPKPKNVAMQEADKAKAKADALIAKKKAIDEGQEEPGKEEPPKDPAKKQDDQPPDTPNPAVPDPTVAKPPQDVAKPISAPPAWVTLGSLDPTSDYQMLVTLNNQGAALETAELNKYFELEDHSGYLGHLKTTAARAPPGCEVWLVGAGTPAAKAGLQPGDIIISLAGTAVKEPAELDAVLRKTRPGDDLVLDVMRGDDKHSFTTKLVRPPLAVVRVEGTDDMSLLTTLEKLNKLEPEKNALELPGVALRYRRWEVVSPAAEERAKPQVHTKAVFKADIPGGLEIYKTFELVKVGTAAPPAAEGELPGVASPGYELMVDIEIKNPRDGPEPQTHTVSYSLDGPNGLPIEGWWYARKVSGYGIRDVVWRFYRSDNTLSPEKMIPCATIADEKQDKPVAGQRLFTAGVDAQYFAAFMFPQGDDQKAWFAKVEAYAAGPVDANRKMLLNTSVRLTSRVATLEPGDSLSNRVKVFLGPKQAEVLKAYQLDHLIYYGWFGAIGNILAGVLHFFYSLVGNYAIAILMLVVAVRSLLFPFSRKQAMNAERMKQLQPELQKVKDKFKGKNLSQQQKQDQARAQMELMQKHGVNPFSGCLMIFFQLPIFVALYNVLMSDIELRDQPIFFSGWWGSNLAAPDMLFYWGNWFPWFVVPDGIFGPYFNLLPIVTVVLYLVQTSIMMPPPTDEQQEVQQNTMKMMMVVIGFMFYKVAAGLCLYFIISTISSLVERMLLPKLAPLDAGAADGKSGSTGAGGGMWPFGGSGGGSNGGGSNGGNGGDKTRAEKRKQKTKK